MQQIYRGTPMPTSNFDNVAEQLEMLTIVKLNQQKANSKLGNLFE